MEFEKDESDKSAHELCLTATCLLNQQIWCWGQDIEYAERNLLVQFGFERIEKQGGRKVASVYRLDLSSTSRVILRGFGVFYGDDRWGGIFLRRFSFAPKLIGESDLVQLPWSSSDLPPLEEPCADRIDTCRSLLVGLTNWISEYELWINKEVGSHYRAKTVMNWDSEDQRVVAAEEVPSAWQKLKHELANAPCEIICSLGSIPKK